MSEIEARLQRTVKAFVDDMDQLLRSAALEALSDLLGARAAAPIGERLQNGPRPAPPAAARAKRAPARASSKKAATGGKRTAAQLTRLKDRVHAYVRAHRGEGIEAIARGMGSATRELTLPIRKLLAERRLDARGNKRATRYFAR